MPGSMQSNVSFNSLLARSQSLAAGLFWGGLMLFIIGLWIGKKHEDLSGVWVLFFLVLAFAGFGLAVWTYLKAGRLARSGVRDTAPLLKADKMIGGLLLVAGMLLLVVGLLFAIWYKLSAFGEAVGLGLFALIAIVCARSLLKGPAPEDSHPFLDALRSRQAALAMGFLVGGVAVFLCTLAWIVFKKPGFEWFPELGALLCLGLLAAACGVWLNLTTPQTLTLAKIRILVLVFGGVAGLIIALAAMARAILWRDDIFLRGMGGWQGENSWHVWACAYTELIGLALMFGSLLLAKADIRSNAVLRRTLYGYNAVLTGLLLLAILVVGNIVFYTFFPYTFDWTRTRGFHTLSTSTKSLLASLKQPANIYVLTTEQHVIFKDLRTLLTNCEVENPDKFSVHFVNPDQDFTVYGDLVQRFPELVPLNQNPFARRGDDESGRGVLIVYGELPPNPKDKVPHAFVAEKRLYEQKLDREGPEGMKGTLSFRGEDEVMKELSYLAQGAVKRQLYILQGNDELDMNSPVREPRPSPIFPMAPLSSREFVDRLKKDNYDVKGLLFAEVKPKGADNVELAPEIGKDKKKEIPFDASTVLILGPSLPISKEALDALDRYMDRGGQLLVCLDLVIDRDPAKGRKQSGLDAFLKKYGVQATDELVMHYPIQGTPEDPRSSLFSVPQNCKLSFARAFDKQIFQLDTARVTKPEEGGGKYKAEIFLESYPRVPSWADSSLGALTSPIRHINELLRSGALKKRLSEEPLPIAVAVTSDGKPRMVVFGDTEFLSSADLRDPGVGDLYYALAASALDWMAERPARQGPRPKESNWYALNTTQFDFNRLVFLPVWLMVLSIFALGAGVWIVRRK